MQSIQMRLIWDGYRLTVTQGYWQCHRLLQHNRLSTRFLYCVCPVLYPFRDGCLFVKKSDYLHTHMYVFGTPIWGNAGYWIFTIEGLWHQNTRVPELPCRVDCVTKLSAALNTTGHSRPGHSTYRTTHIIVLHVCVTGKIVQKCTRTNHWIWSSKKLSREVKLWSLDNLKNN